MDLLYVKEIDDASSIDFYGISYHKHGKGFGIINN